MTALTVSYLNVLTTELHDKKQCTGIIIAIKVRRGRKDTITVLKARKEARGHCKKLLQAVKMQKDAGSIIGERRGQRNCEKEFETIKKQKVRIRNEK